MATFPADTQVEDTGTPTADLNLTYGLLQSILGPVILPSGDVTGVKDPAAVQAVLNLGAVVCYLVGGAQYYGKTTVTLTEGQYVRGAGLQSAIWTLTATGVFAFTEQMANPASYSVLGRGGVQGVTIVGVSASKNPSDGSGGVQFGDIVSLENDVEVTNCQWGLFGSNQNFFAEQGVHQVRSNGCKNPVVLQCAASGGASRTGSFDRSQFTVYHNDTLDGNFGLGGVQLLAGAQLEGGSIVQYGNFGGTGQASVYTLYVSGAAPAGPTGHSSALGVQLVHAVEYNGSGTAPGTILIAANSFINPAIGTLRYTAMGSSSISAGTFVFAGPISGDSTLQGSSGRWNFVAPSASGVTGNVYWKVEEGLDEITVDAELTIAASTTISAGETLATLPAAATPAQSKAFVGVYEPFGSTNVTAVFSMTSGSILEWFGAGITTPSGGSSFVRARATFPAFI